MFMKKKKKIFKTVGIWGMFWEILLILKYFGKRLYVFMYLMYFY